MLNTAKNTLKSFILRVIGESLAVLLIIYFFLQLTSGLSTSDIKDTDIAIYSSLTQKITLEGYIFRDEKVISASSEGYNSYLVSNGEKVTIGQKLSTRYANSSDATIQDRINRLNEEIEVLKKSQTAYNYASHDLQKLDTDIETLLIDISRWIEESNFGKASNSESDLLVQINRRLSLISQSDIFQPMIDERKSEIDRLSLQTSASGSNSFTTYSDSAGYFYYNADGYEDIFTEGAVSALTFNSYYELINSSPRSYSNNLTVGKLSSTSKWYFVSTMPQNEVNGLSLNKLYEFVFPNSNYKALDLKLEKIISVPYQSEYEEPIAVFSCNSLLDGFDFTRKQSVEFVVKTYEGLLVPENALHVVENDDGVLVNGVYCLNGNTIVFKTINIVHKQDGYIIAAVPDSEHISAIFKKTLSLNDVIIVKGRSLKDGKVLR